LRIDEEKKKNPALIALTG